jgi:hypothetical protein
VFTGGGIGALSNYDALSAIPAYFPPPPTPDLTARVAAPLAAKVAPLAAKTSEVETTLGTTEETKTPDVKTDELAAVAPPADPAPAADPGSPQTGKPRNNKQGEVRNGLSFKPGDDGILVPGSGRGRGAADESNDTWHKMLNSVGLGGAGATKPADGTGATKGGGAEGGAE